MPTFMIEGRYSAGGFQGSLAEGFRVRQEYFRGMIALYEGTLTAAYWPGGDDDTDVFAIVEIADEVALKAIELAINASGALRIVSHRLFTIDEIEAARRLLPPYRAPGQLPPPLAG